MADLRSLRRAAVSVDVGGVRIGGQHPIVVQSMRNPDTADVEATARQVAALASALRHLAPTSRDGGAIVAADGFV